MARSFREHPLIVRLVDQYRERLTPRGQYLLWLVIVLGGLGGLDTQRTQVYILSSIAAGLFTIAAVYTFLPARKLHLDCRMPEHATALTPVAITARVASEGAARDLQFTLPRPRKGAERVRCTPAELYFDVQADGPAQVKIELQPAQRGRYILRGATVRATDPLRLFTGAATRVPDRALLVYPRFYSMEEFMVPLGRKYQPGGIPLSSNTGDAIEFVGTREYREGDPIKNIHWRSWAKRGQPVVKEFQEEYFCRIALVLDTFLPRKPTAGQLQAFEDGISVLASVADFFSRSEYIVDILAAGPDIYEVSSGRSLAYLENILDVLACLEPCYDPPFQTIGPYLFEKLAHITTVVAVLQDWDPQRQQFLRQVREMGGSVRAIIVHDGPTKEPWQHVGPELGEVEQLTPADVEALLANSRPRS